MFGRKAFDFDDFALLLLRCTPGQTIDPLVRFFTARIIHLPVIFEWTVVDFPELFNLEHDFFGGIPGVHQNCPKIQALLVNTVQKHILNMIQFGFSITIRIINTVINDPELIGLWIDIHTSHNTNALDNPVRIPAILAPNQFDFARKILIDHGVIKNQEPVRCSDNLILDIVPDHPGTNFIAC